jgi:hypothetical protein
VIEQDINNQSNSDPFTKTFAVLQCLWMIIQSISRTSQGLQLKKLELTTLAFIPCAFFMYAFWWYKPFDPQRPIRLWCPDPQLATQIRGNLGCWNTDSRNKNHTDSALTGLIGLLGEATPQAAPISVLFHTTALAFSGIHLIAWDWDFPSSL